MSKDIDNIGKESMPSVIKFPFIKNRITDIYVRYSKNVFGEDWDAYGSIEFKNGETSGEQKFRGKNFDEVVMKIKAVINELK